MQLYRTNVSLANICLCSYHTSKCDILKDDDSLCFYGYRGETLASLCSSSAFIEILTRHKSTDITLSKCFHNGKAMHVTETVSSRPVCGTTVTAKSLFYNFPVRRKTLKPGLELERIHHCMAGLALMWPSVSLSLRDDVPSRVILQTQKCNSTLSTFEMMFGSAIAKSMSEVDLVTKTYHITGYISQESSIRRDLRFVFVNKRMVLRSRIHKIINSVLERYFLQRNAALHDDEYQDMYNLQDSLKLTRQHECSPIYVINIECPLNEYDITFDPGKTLVEFSNWDELTEILTHMLLKFQQKKHCLFHSPGISHTPFVPCISTHQQHACLSPDVLGQSDDPFCSVTECVDEHFFTKLQQRNMTNGIDTHNYINSLFSHTVRRRSDHHLGDLLSEFYPSAVKKSKVCDDGKGNLYPLNKQFSHHYYASKLKRSISHQQLKKDLQLKINSSAGNCTLGGDYFHINLVNSCVSYVSSSTCDVRHSKTNYMCDAFSGCAKFNRLHNELMLSSSPMIISQDPTCNEGTAQSKIRLPHRCTNSWWHTFTGQRNISKDSQPHIISCYSRHNGVVEQSVTFTGLLNTSSRSKCNVYEKPVQDFRDICCCSSAILTDGDDRSDRMQQEINISASTVFSPLLISRFSDGEHLCVDCFQTNICGDKCDGQYGICSILPISAMVVTHGDIRPISTPSTVGYGAQFAYSNPFFSQLMTSINIIDGFVSDNGNQITSEGIIFENLHSTDVKHSITFQDFARFIQDDSRLLFNGGMLTSSISGELPLEKFMKCVDCDYLHDLFSSEISCQHSDKGKSHLFLSLPSQSQNILHQMGCVEPCVDQQKMLLSPAHFNSGCQAPIFSMHPECKVQCHSLTRFNNSSCYRRQRQVCNPERGFLPKLNNLNVCGYFDHIFWNLGPNTVLNKTQHFETENYQHMLFETRDTVFMANTMKGVQKMDIFDMCILDNESGQSLRKVSRNEGQEKRHSDANLGILASSARRLEFNTVNDLPCCAQAQSKCKVDVCLNKLTCYNDFVKLKQFRKEGSDKERRRAHSINSYRYTVLREYADCTNNVVLYCRSGGEKCTVTFSNQPSKCSLIEKPDVAECASRYHISESHLSLVFPHHAKQSITFFPQGCHGCLPCPQSSDISVFDGKIMLTVSDVIQTICSFEFSFPSMLCLTCDSDTEFLLKNGNRQQAASSVSDLPQQLHWFEDVRSAKCVIGDVSYHDTKLDWHQHDVHSNVRSILSQVECKQLSAAAHTGDSTSFQCAMLYSRCFDSIVANEIDCSSSLSSDICLTEPCSEINFVEGLPAFKFVTCASNNCFIDNSQCYDRVKSKHCISCQCKTWKECNLLSCGDNHSDMKHASLDEKHIPLFISDDRQIEDCECRVVDKTYNLSFLSRNHRHMYNCFDLSSRNCSLFNSCKFEDKNFCTQQKECTLYRVEKGDVRSCGHVLVNDVDMTHACTYSFISSYGMTDGLAVHYKCAKRSTSFTDTCSLMSSFHSGHIMSWCEDVSASISEADKDRNDITVAQSTVFYCTSAIGLTACVSSYAVTLCTANKMNDSGAMLTMNAMFSNGLPDFFCKNMSFLNIKSYKVAHIEDHENKARIDYTSQTLHSCNIAEIAVEQAISSCRDVNKCSDIGFLSDLSCFNSVTEKSVILSSMVNKDVQQCSYIVDSVFNDKYFLPSKNVLASISYENILFKECTFSCEHKPPVEAEFMEISTYSDPKTLSMSIPLKTNMTDQGTPIMTASNTIHMYGETFLSDSKFSQVTDLCEKGASSLHSNTNLWDNGQNEENNCEVVYGKKYDVIIQPEHDVFDNVDWIQFTDPNTGEWLQIVILYFVVFQFVDILYSMSFSHFYQISCNFMHTYITHTHY